MKINIYGFHFVFGMMNFMLATNTTTGIWGAQAPLRTEQIPKNPKIEYEWTWDDEDYFRVNSIINEVKLKRTI